MPTRIEITAAMKRVFFDMAKTLTQLFAYVTQNLGSVRFRNLRLMRCWLLAEWQNPTEPKRGTEPLTYELPGDLLLAASSS